MVQLVLFPRSLVLLIIVAIITVTMMMGGGSGRLKVFVDGPRVLTRTGYRTSWSAYRPHRRCRGGANNSPQFDDQDVLRGSHYSSRSRALLSKTERMPQANDERRRISNLYTFIRSIYTCKELLLEDALKPKSSFGTP